jgi:hypothetical protein
MAARRRAAYLSGMTKWGQKVNRRDLSKPGWREDPDRPGVDRYWTGSEWDDTIPPRSTPATAWIAVALGLLLAAVVLYLIVNAAR